MSRVLDKFTYTSTYKQEFCVGQRLPRDVKDVQDALVDCKGKFIPGAAAGSTPDPTTLGTCSCQPGGLMPPRGARARGQPTNLDKTCICSSCGKCIQPPPIKKKVAEEPRQSEASKKKPERESKKSDYERDYNQEDLFQPPPRKECKDLTQEPKPEPICPRFKNLRPIARGKYGGQFESVLNMPERKDERREPDVLKLRRLPQKGEARDVIHGEEARARNGRRASNQSSASGKQRASKSRSDVRIPGPFWVRQRPDERKEVDVKKKRKFPQPHSEAREAIHGEDWAHDGGQPGASYRDGEDLRRDEGEAGGGEVDEQAEPFPFKKACKCGVPPPQSGPDKWMLEKDWGNLKGGPKEERKIDMPPDVEEKIRKPPEARLSCAPQAEVSNYDQPNAFMRKLYEKYPYLYQILKETPPDELASKVFKDRFLSTYQVDYLHMGVGKEQLPEGGAKKEEKFTGPDGEPEPEAIPGCSYRHSQKGDFGRKKPPEKEKKEKDDGDEEKEEPIVSEYMATISKLGNEIVQDQLYKVAQISKTMKHQYKKI